MGHHYWLIRKSGVNGDEGGDCSENDSDDVRPARANTQAGEKTGEGVQNGQGYKNAAKELTDGVILPGNACCHDRCSKANDQTERRTFVGQAAYCAARGRRRLVCVLCVHCNSS